MTICVAGKNNIAVDSLEYLVNNKKVRAENLLILPNACVEEEDGWQKSLKKAANKYGIRTTSLESLYNLDDLVFISLQYEKIICPSRFKSRKLYNMHFAPLPKYKGMYTSILPILKGDMRSGVTIHEIDDGIDTGDIIAQRMFDIDIMDTERDLYFKYMEYGLQLFKDTIDSLLSGDYESYPQRAVGSTINYRDDIDYHGVGIDLSRTSFEIHNSIRAFIFPEYQLPTVLGKKIHKSILTNRKGMPKKIVEKNNYLEITGADGFIVLAYYRER